MKKTLFETYNLLVCFVSIVCLSIWLGVGTYHFIGIIDPEITINSWKYEMHQTNDKFFNESSEFDVIKKSQKEKLARPPENVLTQKRIASYKKKLMIEKRNNKQTVLRSTIVIVISVVLFFLHWSFYRRKEHS